MGREIQQFTSKCVNEIIYPKQNEDETQYVNRLTNQENRTKYCLETIHSQLRQEKFATYTDDEQLSRRPT